MNDLRTFMKMLRKAGIHTPRPTALREYSPVIVVTLGAESEPNISGYSGFEAEFTFSMKGELLHVGVWE
jgi:hypothetical protein